LFYDTYAELCRGKGLSPSAAAVQIGFSKGSVSGWKKNGTVPSTELLVKIGSFFDVNLLGTAFGDDVAPEPQTKIEQESKPTPKNPLQRANLVTAPTPAKEESPKPTLKRSEPQFAPILPAEVLAQLDTKTETLGQRIRRLRRVANLSIDELAYAVGTDRETLQSWERDAQPIRGYRLKRLADSLGVTLETLVPPKLTDGQSLTRDGLHSLLGTLKARTSCLTLMTIAQRSSDKEINKAVDFLKSMCTA